MNPHQTLNTGSGLFYMIVISTLSPNSITTSAVAAELDSPVAGPSIDGYGPVSYFTMNRAERGNIEFSVEHEGKTYYLTSQEQIALLKQDPLLEWQNSELSEDELLRRADANVFFIEF